jgi:TonB-linked SusC/RagA family outer membrane protein
MNRWTTRVLAGLGITALLASSGAAQTPATQRGSVTGQVIAAETNTPIANAQVFLVGNTSIGGLTNAEGRFTLTNVPAGSRTFRVQILGYEGADQTATVPAGGGVVVRFTVKQQAIVIAPVVATAMGISRAEKSLGYAVQTISAVQLERSPEVSLINALAGQSPGVAVNSSSGQPGASSRITIRGESSFQGDGQPLFVIDGIPISIAQDSKAANNPLELGEMGSRAMDIDPNNIEELTILRGAAATALYGSRAAFGAVIIKTKQGKPGQKVQINATSKVTADFPILGGMQTTYAAGLDGYYCDGRLREQGGWCQPGYPGSPNPTTSNNWGPHKDSIPQIVLDSVGKVRFHDARKDFYNTGRLLENNITLSGGLPMGSFNLGITKKDQDGIFPGSKLDQISINGALNANLTSSLRSITSLIYTNSDNVTANEGYSSLTRTLYQLPVTRDISQAWMPDGSPTFLAADSPHPEWLSLNGGNQSVTGRWIGSQTLQLTITPGLTLMNRIGLDTYTDERLYFENERPWRTVLGQTSGGSDQQKINRRGIDNTTTLSLDNVRLGGDDGLFNISGLVGANVNSNENSNIFAGGDNILVPGTYGIGNFGTTNVSGSLTTKQRLVGVFGQFTGDYKDYLFLTLTGRNDWSSTLPKNGNHYFYPSASLSFVFTEAFPQLKNSVLGNGRVRLSRSKVGSDAPPYRLDTRYNTASGPGPNLSMSQNGCCGLSFPIPSQGGVNGYIQSNSLGNPDLKPESIDETELGLELRMLGNRLTSSISYYDKVSTDQIFSVPSSAATGYTSITRNAGNLSNKGWEVSLNAQPVRTKNVLWDLRVNYSRNKSSVISLAPGVTSIFLTGYSWPQVRIMEGYEYGVIWGYGFKHNEPDPVTGLLPMPNQKRGALLICDEVVTTLCPGPSSTNPAGSNGWPMLDDQLRVLGETQPDWQGSINSSISFKAFSLSGQMDIRQGGEMLNFDLQYTIPPGKAKITENRGDMFTFEGIRPDGSKNTVQLERTRQFWARYGGYDTHENMIESSDYVRLREATLSFKVPSRYLSKISATDLRIYATGRNLKVWTPSSKGDPDGSNYGSANAGGSSYSFFGAPQTRGLLLGVRAGF